MQSIPPTVWIAIGFVVALVAVVIIATSNDIRTQRWTYWVGWLAATVLMSLALTDRGGDLSLLFFAVGSAAAVLIAYFRTSYLKVGGRIYSFWIARTQPDPPIDGSSAPPVIPPPDAYRGMVTATAHWCVLVVLSVVAGTSALMFGMGPETLGAGVLAVAMLAFTGYIDSHDGFPIARRRWVQLAAIVVSSIPVFLLPPIAYLIGYYIDRPRTPSANA